MDFASRSHEEGAASRSWMNPDAVDESRRDDKPLAVGDERSEEPTERCHKTPSPGGAAASGACLPARAAALLRACFQNLRQPWVPRCARHPRLNANRPSGALLLHRKERGTQNRRTQNSENPTWKSALRQRLRFSYYLMLRVPARCRRGSAGREASPRPPPGGVESLEFHG